MSSLGQKTAPIRYKYQVNWPSYDRIVPPYFAQIFENKSRYLILYGGRGSSKSVSAARKLIWRCLTEEHFRYILVRQVYATIKDTSYATIKTEVEKLGLTELFVFKVSPLEIHCVNGNKFIARGLDDTTKLKSVNEPTGVWYEEDIPSYDDWTRVTTSIRNNQATYLQEIFTINPEVEGDFNDHWFYKKFFKDEIEKSFTKDVSLGDDEGVKIKATALHSTYHHNPFINKTFIELLESVKISDPYYYTIYTLGEWGMKNVDGKFYKNFERGKNLVNKKYNEELPLHISFDFNVNPYITLTIWQSISGTAWQLDEICLATPNNRTEMLCKAFANKYPQHSAGLFIYGDPAGRHQDTRTEQGFNDYTIIYKELAKYRPVNKVAQKAPPVSPRGGFINQLFFDGKLLISERCKNTINDYVFLKESADGTKFKEKGKLPNGAAYEKYGHCSDANDYLICELFRKEFDYYLTGKKGLVYVAGRDNTESRNGF
jgi:PBSX family phage terminase large subunit